MIKKIEADIHKDAVTERVDTHCEDLCITCDCTLEEFFSGSQKELTFRRNLVMKDGKTKYYDNKANKLIHVKPGMKEGTVYRFKGEGDCLPDKHQGDLVVTLKQIAHHKYQRVGNDLVYRHCIDLADALLSEGVEFETLCGETIKFRSEQIISP